MNNEPVAWMTENGYLITKDENLANIIKEKGEEPIIPLYTHPASLVDWSYQQGYQVGKETHLAKTLTDEEIEQVGKETMLLQFFQSIEATADHGDSVARAMTAMIRQQAFDFARAILRKAQENE